MANPILLYTSIWSESAKDFTTQVLDVPKKETLNIWINTPGGGVSHGFAMMAVAQEHGGRKEMTVMGNADSFGFFMLLFGDHNKAYDTSNGLIHRAASFWEDFMSEDELKDIENVNKTIRKKLEARIDEDKFKKVTGKTFDDIFDMETRLDVRLTAKQMKKIGLIDEVIKLDVKKKTEIESRYYTDIAALAQPINQNSNNSNKNKMGKLKDLIFGEKDPVLLASIDEKQFVYGKLEVGSKIKATGKGEHEPISGTFEAEDNKITVVDNEITAVVGIDKKAQEFDALKAEIKTLKENQITTDDIVEVVAELKKQHTEEMKELKDILAKAKITKSKPDLPEGEFQNDQAGTSETDEKKKRKIQKNIDAIAKEKAEAFSKHQNNREV